MIIDIHAHAAGNYGSVDSIKNTAAKYDIGKIVLCTSPKNNQNLQEPPSMPFKQRPDSIYMMNRMNRFAYKHFFKDNGDGNQYVYELKSQLPELIVQFLWINPLDAGQMDNLEKSIRIYRRAPQQRRAYSFAVGVFGYPHFYPASFWGICHHRICDAVEYSPVRKRGAFLPEYTVQHLETVAVDKPGVNTAKI